MLKSMGKKIFYNFTLNFFVYLNLCNNNLQEIPLVRLDHVQTAGQVNVGYYVNR